MAWTEAVAINNSSAALINATAESLARAERAAAGEVRLTAFLAANRPWLLPAMESRRGLVYEYRQESPYCERVAFDPAGALMVRLEATKESPDHPTREMVWLPDGRSGSAGVTDRFLTLKDDANADYPAAWPLKDSTVQHLAMGLAFDCALTRLARQPDKFWTEVQDVAGWPDRYRLILHPEGDARLFAGTMLTFVSWCYMHDVRYDRSEILCDAATHHPLEERDFADSTTLVGVFTFSGWSGAAAPGRIQGTLPYEKDGRDNHLEMDARFHFAKPGIWLLDRVESRFQGEPAGSTGTVQLVADSAPAYAALRAMLDKATATQQTLKAVQGASTNVVARLGRPGEDWVPLLVQAAWTDAARKSLSGSGDAASRSLPVIGALRARLAGGSGNTTWLELDGISTANQKEFQTEWTATLRNYDGRVSASAATNCDVRADSAAASFVTKLELPIAPVALSNAPLATIEGRVTRLSGLYHGHGMWMRLGKEL